LISITAQFSWFVSSFFCAYCKTEICSNFTFLFNLREEITFFGKDFLKVQAILLHFFFLRKVIYNFAPVKCVHRILIVYRNTREVKKGIMGYFIDMKD